jgi:hypothetical protein
MQNLRGSCGMPSPLGCQPGNGETCISGQILDGSIGAINDVLPRSGPKCLIDNPAERGCINRVTSADRACHRRARWPIWVVKEVTALRNDRLDGPEIVTS